MERQWNWNDGDGKLPATMDVTLTDEGVVVRMRGQARAEPHRGRGWRWTAGPIVEVTVPHEAWTALLLATAAASKRKTRAA